jgi:hypothetical protein
LCKHEITCLFFLQQRLENEPKDWKDHSTSSHKKWKATPTAVVPMTKKAYQKRY